MEKDQEENTHDGVSEESRSSQDMDNSDSVSANAKRSGYEQAKTIPTTRESNESICKQRQPELMETEHNVKGSKW